ncbi:hypothetical protein P7C73_g5495, partial [Tremellales sp. Uapishka_1]
MPDPISQPPFRHPGVDSPTATDHHHRGHPRAEAVLNSAAQHVVPSNTKSPDNPFLEEGAEDQLDTQAGGDRGVSKDSYGSGAEGDKREEVALLDGTPLDEMGTVDRDFEEELKNAQPVRKRQSSEETLTVPRGVRESAPNDAQRGGRNPSGGARPGAGAMRGMGSVSAFPLVNDSNGRAKGRRVGLKGRRVDA